MNIYFIQFECVPASGSENELEYGGAFVSGWILANNLEEAEEIYRQSIGNLDWSPINFEQGYEVSKNDYEPGSEELEYLSEAESEGEVYLADTWPNEPQDNDSVH